MSSRPRRLLPFALLSVLACATGAPDARAEDPTPEQMAAALKAGLGSLRLGDGIQAEQVIFFPLSVEGDVQPLPLRPVLPGTSLVFVEPERPKHRDDVRVTNHGEEDALLLGGSLLEGGSMDRVVAHDHVVPAGKSITVATLPAAMTADRRRTATPFVLSEFLAPPFLREGAQFKGTRGLVPTFVSHFLDFRNERDVRRSLAAVGQSERLAQYCLVCHQSATTWPKKKGPGTVIGGIAVVRGRVQAMEVFASNEMLKAFFAPLLKSLSFPAAAIELRARKAGIPIPGRDEPQKQLVMATGAARKLLQTVQEGTLTRERESESGAEEAWVLTSGGVRGRVVAWKGRFVHMVVFPADPLEYALYSRPLNPLNPEDAMSDEERAGLMELTRQDADGPRRLTEEEKRVLERLGPQVPGIPR